MKMKRLHRGEKGFTLIELLIMLPIMALVVAAASATMIQVINSWRTGTHMLALRQVQTAGYWVSTDGLQAQSINTTDPTGFPLELSWTTWDGTGYDVSYDLVGPTDNLYKLQRSEGGTSTIVGQQLTNVTACSWNGDVLIFNVTARAMGALGEQMETRTYEIKPRALT